MDDTRNFGASSSEGAVNRPIPPTYEELVERVAKASSLASGHTEHTIIEGRPAWEYHVHDAKRFLAMMKALHDG